MWWPWRRKKSKDQARDRLKLVLAYDRAKLPPGKLEDLKSELLEVLKRYFPADEQGVEVRLEERGDHVVLIAEVPVQT